MPRLSDVLTGRELAGFRALAGGVLRDVQVTIGDGGGAGAFVADDPLICYGCPADASPDAPSDADLVRVATSLPNHIAVNPVAWEPGTAAFFALMRHEDVHQAQFLAESDFLRHYTSWERRREYLGQPPYKNPAEWHAYVAEAEAYRYALTELRLPPGRRIPLLLADR